MTRAPDTLRRLEDRTLVGLLDAAPDAMVVVDDGGVLVLVNAQAERLFGYDRDELVGQLLEVLIPERVRRSHPSHRNAYFGGPVPRPMGAGMELAARRRDGSEFPAEISLSAIDTDRGRLVSAAIRDVSERKRSVDRFRALLEAAPDAMVCVDRAGRIALVNAQADLLFGYGRDELVGQFIEILIPGSARGMHPRHREMYFRDPVPRPMGAAMQLAGLRKDGSEFPAEISLSSLETEDGPLVSATIRDVTERLEAQAERERLKAQAERERLESQLHQSQRLESLGQLAGGVAHDFNNLLAVISNYAVFVGEEIATAAAGTEGGAERWAGARADIEQIRQAADRAARLTHQLLAFARREVVQPRTINLNDTVDSIHQMLLRTIGEHVDLVTELGAQRYVLADPGQIEQVLVNLAVNARDAMPNGGRLAIVTDEVETSVDGAGDDGDDGDGDGDGGGGDGAVVRRRWVRLQVTDTGVGMTADVAARAFEPFFTMKPKGEGSGLGLATVFGIITQAQGTVTLETEAGHGTRVVILLPAVHPETSPASSIGPTGPRRGHESVLVVEDEAAIREVTRRILSRAGYQVVTAATGREAIGLAAAQEPDFDLLLTDVVMPQMLGKDVADHIAAQHPHTRVLYMSGYAQPVLGTGGSLDVGVALIEKPFSSEALLARVREVLDGER